MTAHKHAALMLQYAQDAAETDTPWERWEYRTPDGGWWDMDSSPCWDEEAEYRRKSSVIKVGRHEFPKPITEAPQEGTVYWTIESGGRNGFYAERYKWLQNGEDES